MKFKSSAWFVAVCIITMAVGSAQAQEQVSLERVITLALEKNHDIRLAENASEAATTDDSYAWGAFLPRLNGTGSIGRTNNDQKLEFADASRNIEGPAESTNISGSVQLEWTLFDGTKMFATRQRVSEIAGQGDLLVKDQIVNTIAGIIINYYDIVRQKQQIRAITEQMAVSEERVKLAERKLQVGTGGKPELLQARVDLNAQRTQLIRQESVMRQLKEQLNTMVDMQLPGAYDVADTIIIDLGLQQEELAANIENTNFGLLAARRDLSIASYSLYERKAELLPVLAFNAALTYSNVDNTKLVNPFGAQLNQSDGYNYGLSITVPILNGFNGRRLIQLAQINASRQSLLYEQQRNAVNAGLRSAFVNYDNARKILVVEEENILLAKENVFIALEGFKRGITTYIELRTAQQSLEEAYTRLIDARYNAKLAETELLRLNGDLLR